MSSSIEDYKNAFKDIVFGLEIETCVHMLDNELFYHTQDEKNSSTMFDLEIQEQKAMRAFYDCMRKKFGLVRWQLLDDDWNRAEEYNRWIIMPDTSVNCARNKFCIYKTVSTFCPKLAFYPIEIVTPKLTGRAGSMMFAFFWYGLLMGKNLVYSINDSQGLHVNMSHPGMNVEAFTNLWLKTEPVIWQLIGNIRRQSGLSMFMPYFRSEHSDITKAIGEKFRAFNYHDGRIEVRLWPANMKYQNVLTYYIFCLHLLIYSMINKIDPNPNPEFDTKEDKLKLLDFFFNMLIDKELTERILNLYNKNKQTDWPVFEYKNSETLYHFFDYENFSQKQKNKIEKLQNIICRKETMPIFVYGTLMSGLGNHSMLKNAKLIGKAITAKKYSLHTQNGLPYMHDDQHFYPIHGELYEVDDMLLNELDQLEGHPDWYVRKPVEVISNGEVYFAEAYVNNTEGKLLENGSFRG